MTVPTIASDAVSSRGLHVERDGVPVLHQLDLEVSRGEWMGLIGPNGAGKTTLLHAIGGLIPATGELRVDGADPRTLTPRALARSVAIVPQRPAAPPGLTVTDYVLLGRTPYIPYLGTESADDLDVVSDVLDRLGLASLTSRPMSHLSGGEFQRAVLARALAQQSPLLLLDEPTSALDIGHEQEVLELVDALRRSDGLTVISAMHDLTVAGQFSDRLMLLADGRMAATGTPVQVLSEPLIEATYGARVNVLTQADGHLAIVPRRSGSAARIVHAQEQSG